MTRFARWRSTDPKTCLEASNAHIFRGRCGRSRHRLKTSEDRARRPSAAWMRTAKGPRSWHSPVPSSSSGWEGGAPGLEMVGVEAVAVASDVITDDESAVVTLTSMVGGREDVIVVDESAGLRVDASGANDGGAVVSRACIKSSCGSTER